MFTTYNNNFLIKSQFNKISSTVRSLKKELKFNIVFNLFLAITFLNIFFSKNIETKNFIFLLFSSFFIYNLISNLKEFRNINFFKKDIEIIFNNRLVINMIASPEATNIFITDKKDIEIINNSIENKINNISSELIKEQVHEQDEINNIINPNLRERTLKKRKLKEKAEAIKGKVKEKIDTCLNVIAIKENGTITPFYCKNRYCPVCSYIKSTKNKILITEILKNFEDKTLLFITLTNKNVKINNADELKNERKKVTEAFTKFNKKLKNAKGYIRTIEIVYNAEKNEYNIHIHCILLVINYKKEYKKKEEYNKIWREALEDETATVFDIQEIKKDKKAENIKKISSYITKQDLEKMQHSDNVSNIFSVAENKAKNLTFGGEFKKLKKEVEEKIEKDKKVNKNISNVLLNLKWDNEKNLYIN